MSRIVVGVVVGLVIAQAAYLLVPTIDDGMKTIDRLLARRRAKAELRSMGIVFADDEAGMESLLREHAENVKEAY